MRGRDIFGGIKGVGKVAASVHGSSQLPLPRHLRVFHAWPSVKRPASLRRDFAPGSPSSVAGPPTAILPGYCCPDRSVIGRSCGCLCDSGITWRFLGSDAAAGDDLALLLVGRVWRCASVRLGQSISLRRRDVEILADFMSQFIGDFGVAWHR